MLENYSQLPVRRAVGLMSGTSVDGVDAAIIEISGTKSPAVRLIAFENYPYEPEIRQKIFALFDPNQATADKVGYMNFLLGEVYAKAAADIIKAAGFTAKDIHVIGSHGQTILHAPELTDADGYPIHYTIQIGEGAVIAARTGIPCVSDFRTADMAVGGQGAPLVPFTEYLLYKKPDKNILLQNIGGIGNITVLPQNACPEQVMAFDTGPGNMIIDGLVSRLYSGRLSMDIGGKIAASGTVSQPLLRYLKENDYYRLPLPKSTGRERFGMQYVESLLGFIRQHEIPKEDAVASVTYLTAWSIADAYRYYIEKSCKADEIILGGGGSYNKTLVNFIKDEMGACGVKTYTQEDIGMSSDAKEAVAFALLADCTMRKEANNLPKVTGASRPVILGKISF